MTGEIKGMSDSTALAVIGQERPAIAPVRLPTGPRLGLPTAEELLALKDYGEIVVVSGLAPAHIQTWQAAVVAMRFGHQLGINEFTALQNLYIIDGKVAANASLLHALILRDHGDEAVVPKTIGPEGVALICRRRGSANTTEISYTLDEAKTANLVKETNSGKQSNWLKFPTDMLFARAISRAGRMIFRDTTLGMYVPEEVGIDVIEVDGRVIEGESFAKTSTPSFSEAERDREMKALHAAARSEKQNVDKFPGEPDVHDALHDLAVAGFGVVSLKELTAIQLRTLKQWVQAQAPDVAQLKLELVRAMRDAVDRSALDAVATEVTNLNYGDELVRAAYGFYRRRLGGPASSQQTATAAEPVQVGEPVAPPNADAIVEEIHEAVWGQGFADPDEAEVARIEWRESIDGTLQEPDVEKARTAWATLVERAGGEEWRWVELHRRAPTLEMLRWIASRALSKGVKRTKDVVDADNARRKELESAQRNGK